MGTFALRLNAGATPFASTGSWANPSGVIRRLGCLNSLDPPGCGVETGHLAYIFTGDCWFLDGAGPSEGIPFASLPAGFTVTDSTAFFEASKGFQADCHFTASVGGVSFVEDVTSQEMGTTTALDLYTSFLTLDAETANALDSWVAFNPATLGQIAVEGTYEIVSYNMDCTSTEIAPEIFANVCVITEAPEGEGEFSELPESFWWNLGIYWLYQPSSPGAGWAQDTPDFTGWYKSLEEFQGGSVVIEGNQRPRDPRDYSRLDNAYMVSEQFAQGGTGLSAIYNNHLIYARRYNSGASLGVFDGLSDRTLVTIPPNADGTEIIDIVSVTQTGGQIFVTTLDDGTDSSDWSGRVFRVDPTAGTIEQMGATFTGGQVPYAVCWYNGRLFVGTNPGEAGETGFLYSMLPDYDTTWTEEYDVADGTAGLSGITCMFEYEGSLFFGIAGSSGVAPEMFTRSPLGAFTLSTQGTDGTAVDGCAYLSLCEFGGDLYASYWNPSSPEEVLVRKFDGTSWTTAETFSDGKPVILLAESHGHIFAVMGGVNTAVSLYSSTDGSEWDDVTAFLPVSETTVGIPAFGALF